MDSGRRMPDPQFLRLFGRDVAPEPSHRLQETLRPLVENSDTVAKTKDVHGFTSLNRKFRVDSASWNEPVVQFRNGWRYKVWLSHSVVGYTLDWFGTVVGLHDSV